MQIWNEFTDETRRSICFVSERLLGVLPVEVVPIWKSLWSVVELGKRAYVKNIVKQKVVYNSTKNLLIIFWQLTFKATLNSYSKFRMWSIRKTWSTLKYLWKNMALWWRLDHPWPQNGPRHPWTTSSGKLKPHIHYGKSQFNHFQQKEWPS